MFHKVEPADQFEEVPAWIDDHMSESAAPLAFLTEAPYEARGQDPDIAIDDFVFTVVAAFRRHPHINNVLTHISGASWERVERALRVIVDPLTGSRDLSPVARNIVDLMCADRGVTGRILKPYFRDLLAAILSPRLAARLTARVTCLFEEYGLAERHPAAIVSKNAPSSPMSGRRN